MVNGNPVWPSFGPGPKEAVQDILQRDRSFGADADMERYGPSLNPNGYLRRATA